MNNLYFKLYDDRQLRRAYRKAVVKTDNEFNSLEIELPKFIDDVDVSDFDYIIKYEIEGKYFEDTPNVELSNDKIILQTNITDYITSKQGRVRFAITGKKDNVRFNSAVGNIEVKDTIDVGEYVEPDMLMVWLDEIRDTVKGFKEEMGSLLDERLANARKELEEKFKIRKAIIDVLPNVEHADNNTIYFIPKDKEKENNGYEEYLLVDGKFEKVGDTNNVDLTGYVRAEELERLVDGKGFLTLEDLDSKVAEWFLFNWLNDSPNMHALKSFEELGYFIIDLQAEVRKGVKKEDLKSMLEQYLTIQDLDEIVKSWGYTQHFRGRDEVKLTKFNDFFNVLEEIRIEIDAIDDRSLVDSEIIGDYYPKWEEMEKELKNLKEDELSKYVKVEDVDNKLQEYVTEELLGQYLEPYNEVPSKVMAIEQQVKNIADIQREYATQHEIKGLYTALEKKVDINDINNLIVKKILEMKEQGKL